jgi:hypothetical protein
MLPAAWWLIRFSLKESVIDLDYNNITFNEELSFPYSVPMVTIEL